ncbi:MAG: prevent-host-death protein [bacterium]
MRLTPMREFQKKGLEAITAPRNEVVLLTGRSGPSFFLVPVFDTDLAFQAEQLQRAIALSSLKESQNAAERAGLSAISMDEIDAEIALVRSERRMRKQNPA